MARRNPYEGVNDSLAAQWQRGYDDRTAGGYTRFNPPGGTDEDAHLGRDAYRDGWRDAEDDGAPALGTERQLPAAMATAVAP